MAGGGTQVTKTEPWDEQKDYLKAGFGRAQDLYNRNPLGPSYYGGSTLAGFDPAQQASQRMTMNYAMGGRPQAMQRQAESAIGRGLGGQVDYSQFQPMADVYGQQYLSEIQKNMPAVRQSMVEYQPGGGSRGDIVQGQIAGAASKNLAQNLAGLYGGAYTGAQERIPQFMQQYPTLMSAPLGMAEAVGGVGQARQEMTQQGINRAMARDQYAKNAPQQALANYMNMIGGNYGGTTTQTAPSDPFGTLMGIAQLGSLFMGSDVRIKENIVPDGTWKGHNVYHFNFIGDDVRRRGVMAQEVEQTRPDAVLEIDGIKHVNYGAL